MQVNPVISRRTFSRATLAAGLASAFPMVLRADDQSVRMVKVGLIGCGGFGLALVKDALKTGGVEVLGICDVDSAHLDAAAEEIEGLQDQRPLEFKQYEGLLDVDGLEAIFIATPPQWHALQFIAAVERNLDVYCEKPLAYDIPECRAMAEAAARSGSIVQVGFQRRQSPAFQAVRQYLQEGRAGRVICAEANIHYTATVLDTTPQPPPATLDWDLWCGPAPRIPYSPQVGHRNWRLEETTGHGHLVDWGIHLIDSVRMILGESVPHRVSAAGGIYGLTGKITTPDVLTAHFEFETCPLTWRHRIWGAAEYTPEVSNGIFFFCENETVFVTDNRWEVIPLDRNAERQTHTVQADARILHVAEFLDAVRSREQPGCPVEEGVLSTAAVKLAMIAYDTGAQVDWDAAAGQVLDNPAAAARLIRPYRSPWRHPAEA